jgi:hypothetical protein
MKRLVLAILVVLSLAIGANAQSYRGAINGTVTDPSGAVVPNAQVKATEKATGIDHSTVTTSDGLFAFQDLPIGTYKVTVTASGFAVLTVDNILVTQGAIYTLPVKLSLAQGAVTQVEVSAAALTLDTTTETQTTLVTGDDLQAAPQNGRDFTQMIQMVPGYAGYSGAQSGSMNGARWDQLNWQVDGVDNNDLWWNVPAVNQGGVSGIAGVVLPIDAIDQFSVQTQASPEGGRNPGGTVDLALKSGGNNFHGTAYDYHRNEAFAKKSPFVAAKKRNRNYNFGFSLGGPILKDKLFFFTSFEKQRFSIGLPGEGTEPSTAYQNQALQEMAKFGVNQANAISKALLANLWPSSTLAGAAVPNNYTSSTPEFGFSYNGLTKFDYRINDKNSLSFHWFIGTGNQVAPPGGTILALPASQIPFYYEVAPLHVQNYAVMLNTVFTPRLTNQLLLGVNYFKQSFFDSNNSFDVSQFGLNLAPNFAANGVKGAPRIIIGPVSGGGFDQTGLTPPKGRQDITGHLTDFVSYTVGKHQIRFGGEYRRVQLDEFYHEGALGQLVFDGTQGPWHADTTVTDTNILRLADFMGGYLNTNLSSTNITLGNTERLVFIKTFSLFAQDAWQFSPKLTFNYGVRWDYEGPPGDGKNDLSVFLPSKGLVTQGSGGISSIYPKIYTNFSPRIGFAYKPKADGDLVVRGGFGVFFDTPRMNPLFDAHTPNGASQGIEANPAGTIPVTTVTAVSLNASGKDGQGTPWTSNPIFQPGPACPTGNGCPVTYNIFTVTQNFHTPYVYNFNLNVEKGLGKSLLWQVGYVGSAAHHLLTVADLNQPALGIGALPFATRFPNFGVIDELQTAGNSNYHSLQTVLKVREWHRLSSQFVYSWSHALDDMTQARGNLPQNSFNLKGDYGNSDLDSRNNFKVLLNYDLPNSSSWKRLTNGWQLSSLVAFWSGLPFSVFSSSDTATGEGTQRANQVGNPFSGANHNIVTQGGSTFEQWFNPAAFINPPAGTFGTSPRNGYRGPGFGDVDFSVVKNTPITERVRVQFRIEMFNLFNRVNLAPPSGTCSGNAGGSCSGGSLGQSADTLGDSIGAPGIGPGEPFNMQLALKIIF